ncbi:hypothetical protein TSUD_52180 [Trifolium subterraneum]|uniref:Uncharacterized protein n=1 Tax=Trifolium subterraneum TaxID=3900 RepID=A0A2Z6MIH2_TRISU|nr:hypothetical protein TSUD_52180 [Trifolium subterraneum]
MVHLIKPDLLFLEIDEKRKGFLYQDDSEFAAAFKTAQQYGEDGCLGDEYGWKVMDELEKTFKLKFDKKPALYQTVRRFETIKIH